MTIFLYGPDSYRLKQGVEQVTASYKKKYSSGLNLFSFDLSDKEQRSRFEDSLKTVSFFEEAKLVVVGNSFASKENSEWVKDVLTKHEIDRTKSAVVAVAEFASRKDLEKTNKGLFKDLVSNSSTVRNFEYLEGVKLLNWVRSEFASRNCSIDAASARALIDLTRLAKASGGARAGNESWRLANEIQKLANYKRGGAINISDIKALVSVQTELNIFHLVDAVVSKNTARSYELLYREIKNGRDPHYLLAMMAYGFRSRAHKFSKEELKVNFGKLLEMDTLSKNGALDLTDSLFGFILT